MQIDYVPIAEEALLYAQLSVNNDILYTECCAIKESMPSVRHSNNGGYQSPALFRHTVQEYPTLCELVDTIQRIINQYVEQFDYESPRRVELGNFWLNFNGQNDMNDYHTHPHSVFSGAYYIKAPKDCGDIMFHRISPVADTEWGHFFSGSSNRNELINRYVHRIEPAAGKLVLFPSFYPHSVSPNRSGDTRLSLSFNSIAVFAE